MEIRQNAARNWTVSYIKMLDAGPASKVQSSSYRRAPDVRSHRANYDVREINDRIAYEHYRTAINRARGIAHHDDTHGGSGDHPRFLVRYPSSTSYGAARCNKFISLVSCCATRGDYKSTHWKEAPTIGAAAAARAQDIGSHYTKRGNNTHKKRTYSGGKRGKEVRVFLKCM